MDTIYRKKAQIFIYGFLMVVFSLAGCSSTRKIETSNPAGPKYSKLLNQDVLSVLWYQKAAETRALYYQAFNIARYRLHDIMKQDTARRKLAVIVDIDETVLNNSPYQAMSIKTNEGYPVGWDAWLSAAEAKATPGAVSFLNYAVKNGVDVFYISNRSDRLKDATIRNLKLRGFPQVNSEHVLLKTTTSNKTSRRQIVARTHDIALLCGDNLGDFAQFYQGMPTWKRNHLVDSTKNKFGAKFIVLPNPMYGEWEGAAYDYKWNRSDSAKAAIRIKKLQSFQPADVVKN